MENAPRFALVGIGQSLRGDDAAGLEAVAAWRKHYPKSAVDPRLRIELAELPGLDLLELLEGVSDALLVDAVQSGAPAGTLHLLDEHDLQAYHQGAASAHGLGVAEALRIGRVLQPESLPARITLLGIEAAQFDPGASLSSAVQSQLPAAVQLIEKLLQDWLQPPSTSGR